MAEAEDLLVLRVEALELREHLGLGAALLLGRLADARVRGERLGLLLGRRCEQDVLPLERVLGRGEPLDQPRPAGEERRQLFARQLPR